MSDGLEQLRSIGAQKIHEKTHISREHVQAVLHETFDGLNKIQFLGFISILEREYGVDLSDLRAKGLSHFDYVVEEPIHVNTKVFTKPRKRKYYTYFYITLAIFIFFIFSYYDLFPSFNNNNTDIKHVDNQLIENVKKNIEPVLSESNDSDEESSSSTKNTSVTLSITPASTASEAKPEEEPSEQAKAETSLKAVQEKRSLKIIPRRKVWMGYIDIKADKKYQKSFKGEFDLDTSKDWLLLFGHGKLDIEVNGELRKFDTGQNMRFKYIDGKLTKITIKEFKELNKDSQW